MPELAAHLERVAKELLNELGLSVDGQPFFPEDVQAVAAALAACAREERLDEARWWKLQIKSRITGINFYQHKNFEVADRIELERIAALERAVGGE